jgi:hypothetical protein
MASQTTLEVSTLYERGVTSGTDETVYRAFDCYDPAARAPTPLPCMFLDDEDEEVAIYENLKDSGKTFTFASDPKGEGELVVRCDALFRGLENREHLLGRMEGVLIASRYVVITSSITAPAPGDATIRDRCQHHMRA